MENSLKQFKTAILSISEIDTHFENYFEILSFNIQLIIIYFWSLKRQEIIGNGHIFFAGVMVIVKIVRGCVMHSVNLERDCVMHIENLVSDYMMQIEK